MGWTRHPGPHLASVFRCVQKTLPQVDDMKVQGNGGFQPGRALSVVDTRSLIWNISP